MNPEELLEKSARHTLSPAELAVVVQRLSSGEGDPYDWLLILGRMGAVEHRELVEQFLDASDDPMLARIAVEVLCSYWNLGTRYRHVLLRFIRGVAWDDEDDVRLVSIGCAGALLFESLDRELLAAVYEVFRDASASQTVREASYCAMAQAAGWTAAQLPPASRHFDLVADTDPTVIATVRQLLGLEDT